MKAFARALLFIALMATMVVLIMNNHTAEAMEIGSGAFAFVVICRMPI
ncbi:hypothetical protein [Acetobacter pasteurianus]|nr:hypothetical protein [Acetobacter pasteurianus]